MRGAQWRADDVAVNEVLGDDDRPGVLLLQETGHEVALPGGLDRAGRVVLPDVGD